ncbi:MAG: porin family protein [Terracidiphilus sp.]|jgi:opacity protein-like surface antigen
MQVSKRSPGLPHIIWMVVLAAGLLAGSVQAQVVPSATGPHALWVGGEYSNIHADYPYGSNLRLWGIGGFADYRLSPHIGIVAEARFLRFNSYYGDSEDNYLGGVRYLTRRFGKLQPYAQGLAGLGRIQYPFGIPAGRYFALAPGAGASYSIARKWSVRGEYEYQLWLNWPNIPGYATQSFTPNGFHVGVGYRLF